MLKGRHRSPVGFGPDDSAPGTYSSGHRSFGRGGRYRRNQPPRSFPPLPPPPPSKDEIFMEAGRLAAEFLVAKGILPASSLPPRWQQNGGSLEFKARDRDNSPRMSALDRLGAGNSGSGYVRRQYGEEHQNSRGWGKRVVGYSRDRGSENWGRESGRPRSFDDNLDEGLDAPPGYKRRGGGQGVKAGMESVESESDLDNNDCSVDGGSLRAGSSSAKEEGSRDTEAESKGGSDGDKVEDVEAQQSVGTESIDAEKKDEMEVELGSLPPPATNEVGKHYDDLLSFCRYLNVPRKPRTALAKRPAKNGVEPIADEAAATSQALDTEIVMKEDVLDTAAAKDTSDESRIQDEAAEMVEPENKGEVVGSDAVGVTFSNAIQNPPSLLKEDPGIIPLHPIEEPVIPTPVVGTGKKLSIAFPSFPKSSPVQHPSELVTEATFTCGREISIRSHILQESSSTVCHQADTRKSLLALDSSEVTSGSVVGDSLEQESGRNKGPSNWYTDIVSQGDDSVNQRDLNRKQFVPQGGKPFGDGELMEDVDTDHETVNDRRPFRPTGNDSQMTFQEERTLVANSFKICDLNLLGTPEMTDVPPSDPIQEHIPNTTSILQCETVPSVEFGLSIGDAIISNKFGQSSKESKVVQVIDLEDDSPVENDICDTSKPRTEVIYGNLECFLNNPETAVDLPDIQDGYGHTITDLLGSDLTACQAVSAEINSLQPGITIHGAEGMTGDEDSIYDSLSEIPIDFMDIWDPPHQEYGKFF